MADSFVCDKLGDEEAEASVIVEYEVGIAALEREVSLLKMGLDLFKQRLANRSQAATRSPS